MTYPPLQTYDVKSHLVWGESHSSYYWQDSHKEFHIIVSIYTFMWQIVSSLRQKYKWTFQ